MFVWVPSVFPLLPSLLVGVVMGRPDLVVLFSLSEGLLSLHAKVSISTSITLRARMVIRAALRMRKGGGKELACLTAGEGEASVEAKKEAQLPPESSDLSTIELRSESPAPRRSPLCNR